MKKVALSLAVIAASGAYVWSQWGTSNPDLGLPLQGTADPAADLQRAPDAAISEAPAAAERPETPPAPKPVTFVTPSVPVEPPANPAVAAPTTPAAPGPAAAETLPELPAPNIPAVTAAMSVPVPHIRPDLPKTFARLPVTPASATPTAIRIAAATASFADGTYDGPVVDAYYGYMQVGAVIQGGRLAAIRILRYPNDRRTSIFINRQALPMLRDEVISAQSANVDIVSGATLSSEAFIRSLAGALGQARA